jgi:hypothetical protein
MFTKYTNSQFKSFSKILSLVISVLLLLSCRLPGIFFSSPGSSVPRALATIAVPSTSIPPSATPPAVMNTPTAIPPSATPQVALSTPTATLPGVLSQPNLADGSASKVVFTPGTSSAVEQGTLLPGQVVTYTLEAVQSQPMTLIMDSPNHDITLGVFGPDGKAILNPDNKGTSWQGSLPTTGIYKIQVTGGATEESYNRTTKIAQVVNFAPGATSFTLDGILKNGSLSSYSLNSSAGQTMSVSLNVPASTASLDIFGISTGTLLDASEKANSWTGILPQTQDYVIEVIPNNNQDVNFSLTVSVTNTAVIPPGGEIVIAPGSTAAVMQGTIQSGQVVTYSLQAVQYQALIVHVDSPNQDVTLGVLAPDGSMMFDPANKFSNWQVPLHLTGSYKIQVFGGATTENFTLTTKLPKHVYLGNGTNSITITSATEQGYIVSYVVNGNAGEVLTATLNVPSSSAYLDVFGVASGSLLSYTVKANSWSGVLPETQLYVIEVIPRGGWTVGYSLTITLQ